MPTTIFDAQILEFLQNQDTGIFQNDLTNLNTTRNELLEFAKAQTAKREARLTIKQLSGADIFSIPQALAVNLLVLSGTANVSLTNFNESDPTILSFPSGFNFKLAYREQYYCYPSIEIQTFAGSQVYLSYEEPFADLYPDLSGSNY